jgi:pyridinium-3,5-bisthiocarboxylic acid mononucleotide nickel chelatase
VKIAYFDCFSGISGDMCLGALVDAGVPLKEIEKGMKKMPVTGYRLSGKKVRRGCLSATKIDVVLNERCMNERPAMRWGDIDRLIDSSSFSDGIREKGRGIFRRIFAAEAKVHGEPMNRVHLHELGAVDCMVDVFGTLIGLELLGIEKVFSSPLNLGSGFVRTGHGLLPVPAPATAELLKGVPVYSSGIPYELTTPTGAALVKSLSEKFGEMPLFTPERTGIGAGSRQTEGFPNVLRLFAGEMKKEVPDERVIVIETNIDDMNPQIYGYLADMLFEGGAFDVFLTNVMMKKMRPGIKLSVLCAPEKRDALAGIILKETTSLGVRFYETSRIIMNRKFRSVKTRCGTVRVKSAERGGIRKSMPEYEDCRKSAEESGVPLIEVIEEAKEAAKKRRTGDSG